MKIFFIFFFGSGESLYTSDGSHQSKKEMGPENHLHPVSAVGLEVVVRHVSVPLRSHHVDGCP